MACTSEQVSPRISRGPRSGYNLMKQLQTLRVARQWRGGVKGEEGGFKENILKFVIRRSVVEIILSGLFGKNRRLIRELNISSNCPVSGVNLHVAKYENCVPVKLTEPGMWCAV